jgi:predicted Zn-dependent protease
MAETRFLSEAEARRISERVLSFSRADHCRVNLNSAVDGNTRFAQNQMSTAGDIRRSTLTVTSAFGQKVASSTTNRFDDASLEQVVRTSEELARLAPDDPEYLGELGPQEYPESRSFYESTANLEPEERARAIARVTRQALDRDLVSSGFLVHRSGATAVATSAASSPTPGLPGGLHHHDPDPGRDRLRMGRDRSERLARTRYRKLGAIAAEKAIQSREPRDVEPGRWTVIMEPTAVANMVNLMVNQFGARAADEGRSFFSAPGRREQDRAGLRGRAGHHPLRPGRCPHPLHPLHRRRASQPKTGLGGERGPSGAQLRPLLGERNDREPTGFPSGWYMAGGSDTLEEMIASTARGLLVTRFWYIRSVDPRTVLFTGLTRDGTFLIENGRITHPVKNLRWNETPIFMLNNIEMMGQPVRVSTGMGPAVQVPP